MKLYKCSRCNQKLPRGQSYGECSECHKMFLHPVIEKEIFHSTFIRCPACERHFEGREALSPEDLESLAPEQDVKIECPKCGLKFEIEVQLQKIIFVSPALLLDDEE